MKGGGLGRSLFYYKSYRDKTINDRFHDYPMLGGRTMTDQEEQPLEETKRKERRIKEDADRLAKEQVRKKAYFAREQAIEMAWKANKTKRSERRAAEEIEQLPRDQARKRALFAEEQTIAEAQEVRKLKAKKQS
jgi:hypothetical protein